MRIYFCVLLILFLVTRLFLIDKIPGSLYWDEASIGYNAYSVLKTGADEWGEKLPLSFKAFEEYKLPIFIYSTIPFIATFGLDIFSIRLTSVLYSFFCLVLLILIIRKVTGNEKMAFLTGLFFTTSPWLFIFSRSAYEVNAGLFFYALGIYLYLIREKFKGLFFISILSFVVSIYSYNSFRIITPITLLFLFLNYILKRRINKKILIIGITVVIIGFLPIFLNKGATARFQQVSFYNLTISKPENIKSFLKNYLLHFSPKFLLLKGDINSRSQIPNFGQLSVVQFILFLMGVVYIFRQKDRKLLPLIFLLLIAPVPAAITRESPHALRAILMAPVIAVIASIGAFSLKDLRLFKIIYPLIIALELLLFINYFSNFLHSYNNLTASDWQYGYKAIYDQYKNRFSNYDHVIISDHYDQPYIFFLFYNQYDPTDFRKRVVFNSTIRRSTSLVNKIDKFEFKSVDYYTFPSGKDIVFAHPSEKLSEMESSSVIYNPNGTVAFYVYDFTK